MLIIAGYLVVDPSERDAYVAECVEVVEAAPDRAWSWWGRVIIHVSDVDALYEQAIRAGLTPQFAPRDATWGERYFHIKDRDGHELSFARPLAR